MISVATTEVFAGLQKLDRAQEEASLDLGATTGRRSGASRCRILSCRLSAGLLIFTLSMDEIAVSFFLIGREIHCRSKSGDGYGADHARNQCGFNFNLRGIRCPDCGLVSRAHSCNSRDSAQLDEAGAQMSPTRREFIKYVVAGSVAAGCPI